MSRRGLEIPEREAAPEAVFLNRRKFLKAAGATSLGAFGLLAGCGHEQIFESFEGAGGLGPAAGGAAPDEPSAPLLDPNRILYPADRNADFAQFDRPLTDESVAGGFNNFYKFSFGKQDVAKKAENFTTDNWTLSVSGEVEDPKTYDVD